MISKYDSPEFEQKTCRDQFSNDPHGLLPDSPQADQLNKELGGWSIRPSNTFWTGGDLDPWKPLTVFSQLPGAPNVQVTQDIPKCGVSPGKNTVFGQVIRGGAHAYDQSQIGYKDVPDAAAARLLFHQALKEWLPCFQAKQ